MLTPDPIEPVDTMSSPLSDRFAARVETTTQREVKPKIDWQTGFRDLNYLFGVKELRTIYEVSIRRVALGSKYIETTS